MHVGDESFDHQDTKATRCSHDPDLSLVFLFPFRLSSSTIEISQERLNLMNGNVQPEMRCGRRAKTIQEQEECGKMI